MNKMINFLNAIPTLERWSRRRKVSRLKRKYEKWLSRQEELPMPHYGKQLVVAEYGRLFNTPVLVETGTYNGQMVMAMLERFKQIYSIELNATLHANAQHRFSKHRHIHIFHGSSDQILPLVLSSIDQACLFWLDAHYSGGKTAKGDLSTPIISELTLILDHHAAAQHVLLIDYARCFNGKDDYPTLTQVRDLILRKHPDWCVEVRDDIIRAHAIKKTY